MTELIKIMNRRQSCRKFLEKRVEDEKIVACVNAASLAPSACNTQPYHFYVANTPETVATAAEYCKGDSVNKWVNGAAAFVLVTQEHANMPATLPEAVSTTSVLPLKTSALRQRNSGSAPAFSAVSTRKSSNQASESRAPRKSPS